MRRSAQALGVAGMLSKKQNVGVIFFGETECGGGFLWRNRMWGWFSLKKQNVGVIFFEETKCGVVFFDKTECGGNFL